NQDGKLHSKNNALNGHGFAPFQIFYINFLTKLALFPFRQPGIYPYIPLPPQTNTDEKIIFFLYTASIILWQSRQAICTSLVARTEFPQQGQIYFLLLDFLGRGKAGCSLRVMRI